MQVSFHDTKSRSTDGNGQDKKDVATLEEAESFRNTAVKLKMQGTEYFKKGEYQTALRYYTDSLDNSYDCKTLSNRALVYIKLRMFECAECDCRRALQEGSSSVLVAKIHFRLAQAQIGLELHDEAMESFGRVLKLEPTNRRVLEAKNALEREISERQSFASLQKGSSELASKDVKSSTANEVWVCTKAQRVVVAREVRSFYLFLEAWIRGSVAKDPIMFQRLTAAVDGSAGTKIAADGKLWNLAAAVSNQYRKYGAYHDSTFRIEISDISVRRTAQSNYLATFRRVDKGGKGQPHNQEVYAISAILKIDDERTISHKPKATWLHIHEAKL